MTLERPDAVPTPLPVFQIAHHEFRVSADTADTAAALAVLVQGAQHDVEVHRRAAYDIRRAGDGYTITEDGDHLAHATTAEAVLDLVHARAVARAVELTCRMGWSRLHAASVDLRGRRLLLLGASGSGKTTLTLALGAAGAAVQADEVTMVRDGDGFALARRFHCKPGAGTVLPALAPAIEASPPAVHAGQTIRAVDPAALGWPWRIDIRPVDALVLLDPPGPDPATLEPVSSVDALHALQLGALRFVESEAQLRRQLVRLLSRPAWRLRAGPVADTVAALDGLAADLARSSHPHGRPR